MPFSRFVSITEIQKGWSGDKKYRADDADGNSYLLRITNSPRGERYEDMFRMQKKVEAFNFIRAESAISRNLPSLYFVLLIAVMRLQMPSLKTISPLRHIGSTRL